MHSLLMYVTNGLEEARKHLVPGATTRALRSWQRRFIACHHISSTSESWPHREHAGNEIQSGGSPGWKLAAHPAGYGVCHCHSRCHYTPPWSVSASPGSFCCMARLSLGTAMTVVAGRMQPLVNTQLMGMLWELRWVTRSRSCELTNSCTDTGELPGLTRHVRHRCHIHSLRLQNGCPASTSVGRRLASVMR